MMAQVPLIVMMRDDFNICKYLYSANSLMFTSHHIERTTTITALNV